MSKPIPAELTTVSANTLRRTMARFPSGVTITTTRQSDGTPRGFAAGSLVSVSLDPPLISVCVAYDAHCFPAFAGNESFAVSVLRHDQGPLAKLFATKGADKFAAGGFTESPGGFAVVEGAVATLECEVYGRHPAGDHVILVGLVRHTTIADGDQLLFADTRFSRIVREPGW